MRNSNPVTLIMHIIRPDGRDAGGAAAAHGDGQLPVQQIEDPFHAALAEPSSACWAKAE